MKKSERRLGRARAALTAMSLLGCGLLGCGLLGCGGGASTAPGATSGAEAVDESSYAPIPYRAEQIRERCSGQTLLFEIEGMHEGASYMRFTFLDADEEGATLQETYYDAERAPIGEPEESRVRWAELRMHAAYPAERTTVTDSEVETPAGRFVTRYYEVEGEGEREGMVTRAHFSVERAGPPVHMEIRVGEARVARMILVEEEAAPRSDVSADR